MSGPDAGPRTQALFAALADAPAAFARGVAAAGAVELPFPGEAIRNVAVCGVGAEGALGDLVLGACHERMLVPVSVHSGYALPGWVGPDTLVVLLSASGTDEEALTCALLATERAALCVSVSGGGKLAGSYADEGVPVIGVPGEGEAGAAAWGAAGLAQAGEAGGAAGAGFGARGPVGAAGTGSPAMIRAYSGSPGRTTRSRRLLSL